MLQNSSVYLCFIMQCMMPLWATTSAETNKGIRTKHEHRQPRKFCHAHITIIYIVSATKEILIKWGKKCVVWLCHSGGGEKGILEQVSAIEGRNALTFQPCQLSRQFERRGWWWKEELALKFLILRGRVRTS